MIIIKSLEIKRKYRYMWLKYVNGFDLSFHCAKCLLGTYDKRIKRETSVYHNLELPPAPYYYFCAVYRYETNIHLAFEDADGERIVIDNEYYHAVIENARQIKFDDSRIDKRHPLSRLAAYNTCRNWQFANWMIDVNVLAPARQLAVQRGFDPDF